MMLARGAHTYLIPRIPRTCTQTKPVQGAGDLLVRELARHLANYLDGLQAGTVPVLSSGVLFQSQLRVPAPCPVKQQNDLFVLIVHVCNDLFNQNADDSLLQTHICRGQMPYSRQVLRGAHQYFLVGKWNSKENK